MGSWTDLYCHKKFKVKAKINLINILKESNWSWADAISMVKIMEISGNSNDYTHKTASFKL